MSFRLIVNSRIAVIITLGTAVIILVTMSLFDMQFSKLLTKVNSNIISQKQVTCSTIRILNCKLKNAFIECNLKLDVADENATLDSL